jgi:ADP-ribose pyrophosphatase YjhB (NUDIX family)
MGAGALFFNKDNELLIVKPSYKNYWSIPGGTVDQDESPRQACAREIKEEIDLDVDTLRFLAVDYNSRESEEKNESLQFIFYGGVLSDELISKIKLDGKELIEYRFVPFSIPQHRHLMLPKTHLLSLTSSQLTQYTWKGLVVVETHSFVLTWNSFKYL